MKKPRNPTFLLSVFVTLTVFLCLPSLLYAQSQSRIPQTKPSATQTMRATIDDSPFATTVAPANSGLLGGHPDSLDAAIYNPAGIGGVYNRGANTIKHFQFPYVAAQLNLDSQELLNATTLAGSAGPQQFNRAIQDAALNKPQYARQSIAPNLVIGRLLMVPFYDQQLSAVPLFKSSKDVEILHQTQTGFGAGLSLMEPSENIYVGSFSTISDVSRIEGVYDSTDPRVSVTNEPSIYKENQSRYTLIDHNLGALIRFNHKASPNLAVTLRHIGDTKHEGLDGETFVDHQQLGLSLNVSPKIGQFIMLSSGGGMSELEFEELSLAHKWRAYSEVHMGPQNANSWLCIRAGASYLGASYGAHLNIGIIGLQYANFPVDISADRDAIIERRQSASVFVDLAR